MSKNILLGVNIDHVATVRQARGVSYPDPVQAALIAEQAGADGITAHLREDRRHIQDHDIECLQEQCQTRLNLEIAATPEMIRIAKVVKPAYCCLVPEKRQELTTEGGLDVCHQQVHLTAACQQLHDSGITVSLFIDPNPEQIKAAKAVGASTVEIHTGEYAEQPTAVHLQRVQAAVSLAAELGLCVNAGHGLQYDNVIPIAKIAALHELNIGHAIIARAVMVGMNAAVVEMKQLMLQARS
jgi:pyridoxine 5-phosphate synthase